MELYKTRVGICTTDFDTMTSDDLFKTVRSLGFKAVQFSFASVTETGFSVTGQHELPGEVDERAIFAINNASAKYGVDIAAVNGTFNMAHPDKAVRDEGIRRFEPFLRAVKQLGAAYATLCSGTRCAEHLWRFHPDNASDGARRDMTDTVRRAVGIAEKYDITLALETEAANIISSPEDARALLDEISSPKLKMIMDCANLFPAGSAKRENVRDTLIHAFEMFGRDVVIAHGKDIREGGSIDFCAAGRGIVDFSLMLGLLEKCGFEGDMFLHGIYDISDMERARAYWESILSEGKNERR